MSSIIERPDLYARNPESADAAMPQPVPLAASATGSGAAAAAPANTAAAMARASFFLQELCKNIPSPMYH